MKLPDPQFEGQTKSKLGNTEIRGYVDKVTSEYFAYYLEENPAIAKKIVGKATLAARARKAARASRNNVIRKGAFEGLNLPSKLADCSSRDRTECELFIVEGNSAAGSAKEGRDSKIQAILPLRGKVLNTERARLDKMFNNAEIVSLIKAMGVGIGEQFDISGLRYYKIVFMTDADVDGAHISTLLLTFFFRYMPEVIKAGHVYLEKPPFYGLNLEKTLSDKIEERRKAGSKIDESQERFKQAGYTAQQRFKGLGEMDAAQLWETTMNPENRTLIRVNIEDAEKADAIFTKLMGDEVEMRKNFIQSRAATVDLDDLDF